MAKIVYLVVFLVGAVSAFPNDPVIRKLDDGLRYQYAEAADGSVHLSDLWVKASDLAESRDYDSDILNTFHLFTRNNSGVSQLLLYNNRESILNSNYDSTKKTRMIIHGWLNNAVSPIMTNLVPAFLYASDDNVIVVDWSPGSSNLYTSAVINNPYSAQTVAKMITFINEVTGASVEDYHIVGHGLGAHQASMVGKLLLSRVFYVTSLDASMLGYVINDDKFSKNCGQYTESIHTNAGIDGYMAPNAHVDFYPNGGASMPGCASSTCNSDRAFYYFSESLYGGKFVGKKCSTYISAMAGLCYQWGTANFGGIDAKPGTDGIYHFDTNAFQPFAQG